MQVRRGCHLKRYFQYYKQAGWSDFTIGARRPAGGSHSDRNRGMHSQPLSKIVRLLVVLLGVFFWGGGGGILFWPTTQFLEEWTI